VALIDLDDHIWHLKLWDLNGVLVVKLSCEECNKDFGGINGDHSKTANPNLCANFKKSHMMSTLHIKSWY
jgi:hypothetical protein